MIRQQFSPKFEGYRPFWNRCPDCGQRLVWAVKGKSLKHRAIGVAGSGLDTHHFVLRMKILKDMAHFWDRKPKGG